MFICLEKPKRETNRQKHDNTNQAGLQYQLEYKTMLEYKTAAIFTTEMGLWQRFTLSPYLFACVSHDAIKKSEKKIKAYKIVAAMEIISTIILINLRIYLMKSKRRKI